ncbi:hypothetical protein D1AOALGA4SA_8275 [Olavius algarvensis Delta 1 endosymbiont]|nr:hypothetical protein D1AOALGA4SA_8275 [Olavius algarvensis Delta 1 endosymbiont]
MPLRQVGAISDYTVIEAVGRTLASLLMTEMEDPVTVTVSSPGEDYGAPVGSNGEELGTSRVNLFLYNVKEAAHLMNMDWVDIGEGRQIPYPLSLQLYYMINIFTPDKSSNLDEHRILGDVMRVFHANPIVDAIYFEGTLNPNEEPLGIPWEELKLINHPLPLDDLAAIWHAINKPYRLSVAYETSVAMIQPPDHQARRVRRVDVTHVKASPLRGAPAIDGLVPASAYAGSVLQITGDNFGSPYLKVYLDGEQIEPDAVNPGEITLTIPAGYPPGLYWLQVSSEEGSSNRIRFEEISPFIYRLDPQLSYPEDDDFPRTAGGSPQLTIWGGNFRTDPPTAVEILATRPGSAATTHAVDPADVGRNNIRWEIPAAMRSARTRLVVRLNGLRESNPVSLEIPQPQIYRADPDPIAALPQQLTIMGDHFRSGGSNTELFVHAGPLNDIADLDPGELVPIEVVSDTQIRTTLPATLAAGSYQLVVRVYHTYFSAAHGITVATS